MSHKFLKCNLGVIRQKHVPFTHRSRTMSGSSRQFDKDVVAALQAFP